MAKKVKDRKDSKKKQKKVEKKVKELDVGKTDERLIEKLIADKKEEIEKKVVDKEVIDEEEFEDFSNFDFSLLQGESSDVSNFRLSDSLMSQNVSSRGLVLEEEIEDELPALSSSSSNEFYSVGPNDDSVSYNARNDAYSPVKESRSLSESDAGGYRASMEGNYGVSGKGDEEESQGDFYDSGKAEETQVGDIRNSLFQSNLESAATQKKKKNPFDTTF